MSTPAAHGGNAPPPMPAKAAETPAAAIPPPEANPTSPVLEAPLPVPAGPLRASDGLDELRRYWRLGQWLAMTEGDTTELGTYRGAMRLVYASELNLPPALTARLIHVQRDGRVTLGAELLRAVAAQHGIYCRRTDSTDTECTCVLVDQDGAELGRSTYTIAQAERAGLLAKTNWRQYPEDMLWARASARAIKDHLPGGGLGLEPAEGYVPTAAEAPPELRDADLDYHGDHDPDEDEDIPF
jgi:hypothetical protein